MTQLEDVARSCCQGLGMQRDWHKLRAGCSSPCHKRPGTVSSALFFFFLFVKKGKKNHSSLTRRNTPSVIICMGLTRRCLASLSLLQLVSSLSHPPSTPPSLPPSLYLSHLAPLLSAPLSLSVPLPPFSADGGGAIHANYGGSSRWLLAGGKRINPCKDFTSLGNPFNVASWLINLPDLSRSPQITAKFVYFMPGWPRCQRRRGGKRWKEEVFLGGVSVAMLILRPNRCKGLFYHFWLWQPCPTLKRQTVHLDMSFFFHLSCVLESML